MKLYRLHYRLRCCALIAILLCLTPGCGESTPAMRVWGTVQFDGKPIETGQIIFFPQGTTKSPSTGGPIRNGRYEIAQSDGPYAGGTYRVEITAQGPLQSYSPNASGKGVSVEVPSQYIPAIYNRQSTLSVTISAQEDQNQHNFELAR